DHWTTPGAIGGDHAPITGTAPAIDHGRAGGASRGDPGPAAGRPGRVGGTSRGGRHAPRAPRADSRERWPIPGQGGGAWGL
ncbi:MAG: hypothetical protein AVDCRST_MAG88-485, partial [uncultured Thermomicrobiales bacterium]